MVFPGPTGRCDADVMRSEDPRFRASHTLATLRALSRVAPDASARVRARIAPEVRRGLEEALRGELIPAAWDLAVVEAILAELGPLPTRAVMREMMRTSLGSSLLGGLLRTAQALFGRSPEGLLRWAGRAYSHVARDCGEVVLEGTSPGSVVLRLRGLPGPLAVPAYLDAIAGAIEAIFDVCAVEGSVTLGEVSRDGARYEVKWWARSSR